MAETVAWSDVIATAVIKPFGPIRSLSILDGYVHRVRFVGNPVRYFKYFVNGRFAICRDPTTCPVRAKYQIDPVMRYAVNVLDRDETDPKYRLKILDANPCVLRPIAAWARAQKMDPGGATGSDFNIEAQGKGQQRRYSVLPLDVTPFSDEEKKYIKSNFYDLPNLYTPVPDDQIEQRLFGGERTDRVVRRDKNASGSVETTRS